MASTLPTANPCCDNDCSGLSVTVISNAIGDFTVNSLADLRAIASNVNNKFALLKEIGSPDGIPSGVYVWVTSNAVDDGIQFIRPNDYGTQLWQKII